MTAAIKEPGSLKDKCSKEDTGGMVMGRSEISLRCITAMPPPRRSRRGLSR